MTMLDSDRILDYRVLDSTGSKVGTLENLYAEDATGQPQFGSVKTGWIFGKHHVVPLHEARIDHDRGEIFLPYSLDQIKGAPAYGATEELTDERCRNIYEYYGASPRPVSFREEGTTFREEEIGARGGEWREGRGAEWREREGLMGRETEMEPGTEMGREEMRIPLAEEELRVGKRAVAGDTLHLRKVVRSERVEQPVELRREEIHVERTPASGEAIPPNAFQEEDITVSAMREEPVVEKRAHLREEARVFKTEDVTRDTVKGEVRREELEGDRGELGRKRNLERE